MPSFLSKLLGRKKPQGLGPFSDHPGHPTPLLEGKFEAISPNVSPSAAFFTDPGGAQIRGHDRPKDKESPFYIFRTKGRPSSDVPAVQKAPSDVPHLSLNLPITKDRGRSLDVVFESDPEAFALSNEAAIRERRLTPHESLALVRACSQVIIESGLETLGIMHPHWHSTSPGVQQRLISLYLLSLASTSPDGVASPTSPTAVTTFESELQYSRSPHDVAALLRWGLRHLKLEGDSFGKESGDWTWYSTFAEAERAGSYPPDAFSNSLVPQLPSAHAELLLATLDIISSLSTRSEANGSSGSKLSKFFGLWLLTSEQSTEGDDWNAFYDRWDRAGRILEHLFLARIRNDAPSLPRRLTNLVEHYPYDYGVDVPKDDLLPRPRFSTRQFDALFVQLDTEYTGSVKPKSHPLRLISDAFHAQSSSESATAEDDGLWDTIKKASFDTSEGSDDTAPTEPIPIFANVFSDETIRLLSLIPADASDKDKSAPTFTLRSPVSPGRPRSSSLPETPLLVQSERGRPPPSGNAIVAPGLSANNSTAPTTAVPETPSDWLQFSNQGFGTIPGSRDLAAKLWDDDVEKTVPPPVPLSRKSSHRAQSRHSSLDDPKTPVQPVPPTPAPPVSKVTLVAKVKLDEAFIDFWADSLLDPISKRWPRFVLCQLKTFSPADTSATPTPAWLIIEQRFVHLRPVSPVKEVVEVTVPPARPRPLSPQTESSRLSAAFSIVSKKRFGLFTGGNGDPKSPKDRTGRLPQVGEYGEVVGGTEDDTVVTEKQVEVEAIDKADGATAPAITMADATVPVAVGVSAAAVASAAEVTSKEDAPSELADISAPKADVPVKGESPHGATSQNGLVNDEHHDEGQCEPEPKTAATQDPAGDNNAVIPPVMSEPIKTEAEPAVSGVEAEPTQPAPECVPAVPYSADIDEAIIAQAEVAHPEPEPLIRESAAVVEPSALEPSSIVPTATAVIEGSLHETPAPQVVEPEPVVEAKPTAQDPLTDEAARDPESAHTPDEVPAPLAHPDLISEIPNTGSEGVARDSPSEPASVASPHPISEQPTPEDDVQTVGEIQVATTDLVPVIVEDPPAAELEPVPTDDTVPAIQTISTDKSQATDSADAAEMTVPLEEPAPVVGEVIVEGAQPVAIPERDDTVPGEHNAEAATPEPEITPAPVADDTASAFLENGQSAAAQAAPEERAPRAEPDAEHNVFVTQSAEGLPSQAAPQIQDPVIDEQLPAEETTPIPEASASNFIPAEDLATSHEDEAVADDAPVTRLVPGGASVPSENSPPDVPVTEPVPEPKAPTAFAHDSSQSPTNDSTEPVVTHNEQVDAGEPSVAIAAGDASIANPVDEVSELKAEVDIVAEEAQAASKELESAIPTEEPPAPVTEISTSVIEEPVVAPTEAEIPVEAPAPVVQENDATAEEATLAAAETPAPTLEPATDVPAPEVTASEVAKTTVEAPAPAPVEPDVLEEVAPVAANALVVEPASAIGESTPSVEDVLPVHDHTLAAEQSVAVPEEPPHLPEETASAIAEPLVEPAFIPEEPTPAATEAAAEPAPGTEEAAPATTEAPAEFAPVSEEPAPISGAAAPTTMEAPAEPAPVTEEAAPVATEAPADPACVLEEAAADAVAVAPITETPPPEQFAPDLDETPAPPDEPAPIHGEDEPTVPEPPVEDPAPVPVLGDPAPTTESATPTADDAPAEGVQEGAESPSAEPAAAEPATAAEEDASGLEGGVGAEPAAEEAPEAISSSETPAIADQEPPSMETTTASELEIPVGASVSDEATEDAANTEPTNTNTNEAADDAA